ncbi:MAG TPA: NAD(P)-dependent oxidoreductase [Beijerinckiaceae bacterium]|nr:NAD(P)-dependent oxidoreductase [Beijerinckiaceae bacterium]
MQKPLVIARCEAGQELSAKLVAWECSGLSVAVVSEAADAAFDALLPDATAILHVLKPIAAEVFARAPRLKLVQKVGVGVNTIDLEAARRHGVAVCNMPGTNTAAVAELALALMLAALRRLPRFDRAARTAAGWALPRGAEASLGEIGGRTVGLVGAGAVPRRLAPILAAMGAEVIYWSRAARAELTAEHVGFDALLARADILSLHLPLTTETERLVGPDAFARMKPGVILVNTARGGLVDEAALIAALAAKRVAVAALDVLAAEPPGDDHPLLARDDVIATPHVAWLTAETWERSLGVARENVLRALAGMPLLHRVV